MDSYYKELIQKERAAFERVLISKLNVREREIERKFQKQHKEASQKLQRAEALETRFKESQAHAKRLQKEIDAFKKSKKTNDKAQKALKAEHEKVRGKLDNLWSNQERDLEHCRLMTRYEVEKAHQTEIADLKD